MNDQDFFHQGKLRRELFPDPATLTDESAPGDAGRIEQLNHLYRETERALDELRLVDPGIKTNLAELLDDLKQDVVGVLEDPEELDLSDAAVHFTQAVSKLLKQSSRELRKVTGAGDDLAFLAGRRQACRRALLGFVTLLDPADLQFEMVGTAVLIHVDADEQAFSLRVDRTGAGLGAWESVTGPPIEPADLADKRALHTLIRHLYRGRTGILERCNVLFATSPAPLALTPRQVLRHAAKLYRDACETT